MPLFCHSSTVSPALHREYLMDLMEESEGPYFDPTLSGLSFPNRKKDQKKKSTLNGTNVAEPEEEIDTSKLDIKFVDQTWDLKRVGLQKIFFRSAR